MPELIQRWCNPERIEIEGFNSGGVSVELASIYKVYKVSPSIEVQALRGVTMSVPKSSYYIVMGPSGSGKTTLLNIIGGVDKPTAGKVVVEGEELNNYSDEELEKYRLCIVGYIFQSFNLVPVLNAIENIILPMIAYGIPRDKRIKRAKWLIRLVGLEKRMYHKPSQLSGGEQQRVAIAVALANDPPLILADEPTAELDYENAMKIIDLLSRLSRDYGKTVIVSTHDPRIITRADKIVLLEDGVIKGIYLPGKIEGLTKLEGIEGFEEVIREKIHYYRSRLDELVEKYSRGLIGFEEFDREYNELASMIKALEKLLVLLGKRG